MKSYEFCPIHHSHFFGICFSLTYERPDLVKIEKILKKFGLAGNVLLDLRACNGERGNRFFQFYFDGESMPFRLTPIPISEMEEKLLVDCNHFYKDKDTRCMV